MNNLTSIHEAWPNNLPHELTSFVGRQRELVEIADLIANNRLVTLTGAGGCGKTRLAIETATRLLPEFDDGIWLVELASVIDALMLPQIIASALGVAEQPNQSLIQTLLESIRRKRLLLLLDNCEHLIDACAATANALLRSCANVRILATSRQGLGIAGETLWLVPSLNVPNPANLPPVEILSQIEAVRLFADRTRAIVPAFRLTEQNARAVAEICSRLEGIPLAIELAAARAKALSVDQIAARLGDGFKLLTVGHRAALPRHQTLRAVIDWSYDLLSERERALLRRLSLFTGGFTLEAAESVCSDSSADPGESVPDANQSGPAVQIATDEVLDLLTSLVDKSLVLAESTGAGTRYRLLEPVRQYCRDKLEEAGEQEITERRRIRYYVEFAESAEIGLNGPLQVTWLNRLEAEVVHRLRPDG